MPGPILELVKLRKAYGGAAAVGPLSLAVAEGEFVSLLGPSGCGKTTTLRCIAGFERPTSGDIRLDGISIIGRPAHQRDMGFVFQNYALFPHLTAADNVAFGLRLRRRPREETARRVAEALELVGLAGLGGRYPSQLSGGQQQRVALARSLVLQPRILLLDEPLSNLDFKFRIQMRGELKALQRRLGITTIYVTHDRGEGLTMSDRIVVLANGSVQQIGAPRELYERPRTPFVADFIGASNLLPARLEPAAVGRRTVVRIGGLSLQSEAAIPSDVGEGDSVVVLIRPERIVIVDGSPVPTGGNVFSAQVADVTYLGEDLHVRLGAAAAGSGIRFIASVKSSSPEAGLAPGQPVTAYVAYRDVRLLAPDAS